MGAVAISLSPPPPLARSFWSNIDSSGSRHDAGITVRAECVDEGNAATPDWKPVIPIEKDTVFHFALTIAAEDFATFTDVDQSQMAPFRVFVFGNTASSPKTADGDVRRVQIHNGAIRDPIRVVAPMFKIALEHSNADASRRPYRVTVHDEAGNQVLQSIVAAEMSNGSVSIPPDVGFDLSGRSEGIYEVRIFDATGASLSTEKIFVSDSYRTPGLFGFVRVRYSQDILDDSETQHAFDLKCTSRSIPWIYKVKVEDFTHDALTPWDPDKVKLKLPAGFPTTFTRATVAGAPRRLTFSSAAPIALREAPYTKLVLQHVVPGPGRSGNDKIDVLVANLPNPRLDRLSKDENSNLLSEMHVTVK